MSQDFSTTSGGADSTLTIDSAMLNSGGGVAQLQPVRAGFSIDVNVSSSNQSVGTITTSPVTFNGPADFAVTQFHPLSAGNTNLTASSAGYQGQSVLATVTTPNFNVPNLTVGRNLQQPGILLLGQAAPAGGLAVTLTSNSAQLRLSASATTAGSSSIVITIPQGGTSAIFYAQALIDVGSGTYTATASGFNPKTGTITFAPSAVVISGPFGFGFQLVTSASGPDKTVTVSTALLDSNNVFVSTQALAGGSSLSITLTNSKPAIGTVISPVSIVGGSDGGDTTFHPLSPGDSIISIVNPAGYAQPNNYTNLAVHVN